MTIEEIIEQLDGIVGTYEILIGNGVNSDILDVDDIEAIREAISALSEQESPKERMEKLYLEESLKEDLENLIKENERLRSALSENKGDLISREAIEEIKSEIPKIHELFDIAYEYNQEDSTRTELSQKCTTYLLDVWQTLGAIVDNYSPVENKGEWIPVSERLPEEREWYLAVFKEKDTDFQLIPRVADYVGHGENRWELVDEDGMPQGYIDLLECVAWQPLPEPYKADSKDPNDLTHIFDGVTEIPKDAFKGWTTEKLLEQIRAESEEKANGKNE